MHGANVFLLALCLTFCALLWKTDPKRKENLIFQGLKNRYKAV